MPYLIERRRLYGSDETALTEMRRVATIPAARRAAHEIAYRFFEAGSLLDRPIAHNTVAAILRWDGSTAIDVTSGGERFLLAAQ
ncbi:hypothetical protein [Sphingomonas sp.]|uniref:hypothetical protein n=1 Tax=Sphingomonas sp. TaxID=28214 RepID=UPI002EDB40AD